MPYPTNLQPLETLALPDALLNVKTVSAVTALSAASIYRKLAAKAFPAPIRMGQRCTRWRSGDVRNWIQAQQVAG